MRRLRPGCNVLSSVPAMRSPSNTISPALAVSICAMILSSVDLPAPEGPTMVRSSPAPTENDMSWMIHGGGSRPARAGKRLPRFLMSSISGAVIGSSPMVNDQRRAPRSPAQQEALANIDDSDKSMHDDRGGQDRDEHLGGVEVHRAGLHQIAQAAIRRDQLGDHGAADRIGHGNPKAGEDRRHRARKHDMAADLTFVGAHHLRHLHELG